MFPDAASISSRRSSSLYNSFEFHYHLGPASTLCDLVYWRCHSEGLRYRGSRGGDNIESCRAVFDSVRFPRRESMNHPLKRRREDLETFSTRRLSRDGGPLTRVTFRISFAEINFSPSVRAFRVAFCMSLEETRQQKYRSSKVRASYSSTNKI